LYIADYGRVQNPVQQYCSRKIPSFGYIIQFYTNLMKPVINMNAYTNTIMDDATKERIRKYLNDYVNNNQASASK